MTSGQPRAFFTFDLGSATSSVALIGHVGGRWRLIGHASIPCGVEPDAIAAGFLRRLHAADPEILVDLGASLPVDPDALALSWPRCTASTAPPGRIVVLASSKRRRHRFETVAARSGWRVVSGSGDETDAIELERMILSAETQAVLVGADRSLSGEDKRHLPDLTAMVAAAAHCRSELTVVLAGGAAAYESVFFAPDAAGPGSAEDRGAKWLIAPDAEAGSPPGSSLQEVLEGLRADPADSRLGVARSIASLAGVLDHSIEVVEVGLQGGLIARSEPIRPGRSPIVSSHACPFDGSFAPANPSDEVIDGLTAWSTQALDRHRLTDRLVDLRVAPWGNCDGDGATFRLAAAKAAIGRLLAAVPEIAERPMPDLLVAAGGILSSLPAQLVALGLADVVRRPGVSRVVCDVARVLGPLGTIEDEGERRRLLAGLADDVMLPIGSLVIPGGLRPGKSAGRLKLKGKSYVSEIEMHPGAIQVVDLPGGRSATAELEFRDNVRLGSRGKHFAVEIGGGLAGILLDMRDIPLDVSERPDTRRAALEAWQRGMWPAVDD